MQVQGARFPFGPSALAGWNERHLVSLGGKSRGVCSPLRFTSAFPCSALVTDETQIFLNLSLGGGGGGGSGILSHLYQSRNFSSWNQRHTHTHTSDTRLHAPNTILQRVRLCLVKNFPSNRKTWRLFPLWGGWSTRPPVRAAPPTALRRCTVAVSQPPLDSG